MDEREFLAAADSTLARLEASLDNCDVDMDIEAKPGGIIELEFEDGSKIIINRHVVAREIWIAARSGGFHFQHQAGRWIASRDGTELHACLERCIGEQSGQPVALT
jgi:CyaY protein